MPIEVKPTGTGAGRVVVVVPIFDEEQHVSLLLERFRPVVEARTVETVVFVDDGSTDRTAEVVRACPYVQVVRHETRRGCGAAIRSGFQVALRDSFDTVVVMAGNGKDNPAEIARLLAPLQAGAADYVQGSRFLAGGTSGGLPMHRLLAMRLLTWTFRLFLWKRFTDCTNGFRAYRTAFLRDRRLDWNQDWLGNDYEMEVYLHYKASALGYRVHEVPVSKIYSRKPGIAYSKARLTDWLTGLKPVFLLRLGLRR
jgi:dolichol-phosphate mannosyltransferase